MEGLAGLVDRIVELIPPFQALVVACCFIIGIMLVIGGVRGLAIAGEMRASGHYMGSRSMWITPLVSMSIGFALVALSETISAFLFSFFTKDTATAASEIFAYAPEMLRPLDHEASRNVVIGLVRVVQFIGLIGFVRGLFLLNKASYWPAHGYTARGLTHLIGGTLAINIVLFVSMLEQLVVNRSS